MCPHGLLISRHGTQSTCSKLYQHIINSIILLIAVSLCGLCAVLAGFHCRRRRRVGLSSSISFPFRIICCFLSIHNPATCLEGCLHFPFSRLFCSVLLSFPAKSVTLCETLLLSIFIFSLLQPKVEAVSKQQTSFNKVYTISQIEKPQKGKREVIEKWHFSHNRQPVHSVADPAFPRGGCPNSKGGCEKLLFSQFFLPETA